uniref:Peptidase S1 domain-containing protein n=1 Tax=Anopheles minimus TaxID=112268 RepID=A0A182VR65_9DIPT
MKLLYALAILSACVKISYQKTSPCPAVFSYDERDDSYDTWFGTIRLKSNVPLYGIFVDIIFSSPVLSFGTFLRQYNTEDNVHFHIMDKSYRVRAGEVVIVKFFVRYAPDRPVPLLRQIRFNGQNICTETRQNPVRSNTRPAGTNYGNPHGAASSETEDIIADVYTPVVQPINSHVTHPPVESHVQPLYSSSSSGSSRGSGTVATRATDAKSSHSSPAHSGDVYPPRFSTDEHVEHSSSTTGSVDGKDLDSDRVANRRVTSTTYQPYAEERKWDQPTPRSHPSSEGSNASKRVSSVPLIADKGFTTQAPLLGAAATPASNRDQYFAGDYAFLQQDSSPRSTQTHYINKYEGDICGTVVPKANPLVTHGTVSERGQFPWHGALYRSTVTELKYLCGATLISRRASITAAHCVTLEKSSKPVDAGSLLLYFGKIDLSKWNGPEEDAQIRAIHIPAQYQHERFFNDIAVLVLKEDIKYSNFVRPVCLWNFDDDYKTLINKIGLVPGWGYNEHGATRSQLIRSVIFDRLGANTDGSRIFKMIYHSSRTPLFYTVLLCATISLPYTLATYVRLGQSAEVRLPTPQTTSCSDLFTIDHEDAYRKQYDGTLVLRPNITIRYVQLVVQFDREVEQLTNYFGRISTIDHQSFHIANLTYPLRAGTIVKIPLEVSYTSAVQPTIVRVEVNGVTVCPVNTLRPLVRNFRDPWAGTPVESSRSTTQPEVHSRNGTTEPTHQFNSSCQAIRTGVIVSAGRWDAVMELVADNTVDRALIEIVFDQPVYMLGNLFGEVTTEDSVRFSIENRTFILAKDAEIELNFFIRYNQMGPTPDVVEVNFNGHNYCQQRRRRVLSDPRDDNYRRTTTSTTERSVTWGNVQNQSAEDTYDSAGWPLEQSECATVLDPIGTRIRSRIIGGVTSNQGEHPWHVAIYLDEEYQCGGSIIGRRWILTAAHCLTRQNTNETLEVDLFRVYTGIIDISTIDDHFYRTADQVIIHRDYNPVMYTTDIGLLRLKRNITFNSFIKPVCLYNRTVDISTFYGREGKVTGWGFNRNGVISNVLNYLEVPVVSQKVCSQRNVQFNGVLAVGESFCAGHADGNSVCNGDSGGGLVFAEGSRYHVRGIVSISAQRRNLLLCDPNQYSVFTDVSKFLSWIRQQVSSEPCLRNTVPAVCCGFIPIPSSVMMALVAGGTLNSSAANFRTAVNGVASGTLNLKRN